VKEKINLRSQIFFAKIKNAKLFHYVILCISFQISRLKLMSCKKARITHMKESDLWFFVIAL